MAPAEANLQTVEPWRELRALVDKGDAAAVLDFMRRLPPAETSYTISRLNESHQSLLLTLLLSADPDFAADLMGHFADEYAAGMIRPLDPEKAAALVEEMDSDEQVDVLGRLDPDEAEAILRELDPEEAADARELLQYEEDTAGGIMITEYLSYGLDQRVSAVRDDLLENHLEYQEYETRYLYTVDATGHLMGLVHMRDLILQSPSRPLGELHRADLVTLLPHASLEDMQDLFDRVDFSAVPVVDSTHRLLGVVRRSSVQEAVGERESENFMKFGGIIGGEELRSMPSLGRGLRRLAFLMPNIALSYLAVSVIALYEPVVQQITALAIFLPMVANLTGAAGNQAVAVSIRELSLGLLSNRDVLLVWRKEVLIGAANGLIIGVILGIITHLTRGQQPALPFVVAGAYAVSSILAVTFGGALPLALKRIGVDPAMLSSPILTTLTDTCSFFFVLTFAALFIVAAG